MANSNEALTQVWLDEFCPKGICGLCGNSGRIDTTESALSPDGHPVGGRFWCICPNGRALKDLIAKETKS